MSDGGLSFFFLGYGDHRDLHSFPTRRSSDLVEHADNKTLKDLRPREWAGLVPLAVLMFVLGLAPYLMTEDRKSTRLNSSHANISYAVFCLKKTTNIPIVIFNFDGIRTLRSDR